MLWIRIRNVPYHFGILDQHLDPLPHQIKVRIRIRIKIYKLDPELDPDQHHFADFFKGLSLFFEAWIWIRIRIRVKSRIQIRIRIRIKLKNLIRIRIRVISQIRIRILQNWEEVSYNRGRCVVYLETGPDPLGRIVRVLDRHL